jgi:hypothetical protein
MSTDRERGDGLPPLLDFREFLDDVEREADADVSDEVAAVEADLDRFADRERGGDSIVDDMDDDVLALREELSGDADWYAEAIQNRIRQYRSAREEAGDTLDVADPRLVADGEAVGVADRRDSLVGLEGKLVNQGDAGDAVVLLAFYDDDGVASRKVESREYDLDAGERRPLDLTVYVPPDAAYYAVSALDAEDPRSVEGGGPVPERLRRERREADEGGDGDAADVSDVT